MTITLTKIVFTAMLFSAAAPYIIHARIPEKKIVYPQPFFQDLWKALYNDDAIGVEEALESDIDINKEAQIPYSFLNGVTPLILSVWDCDSKIVELLAKKTDVDTQGKCGYTALTIAAAKGDLEKARILIENGANVNLKDKSGLTPLSRAILGGNSHHDLSMLELLLAYNANINENNGGNKRRNCGSSLTQAVRHGLPTVVQFLLERKAHFNVQNKFDRESLKMAKSFSAKNKSNRYSQVLELLSKDKNIILEKK